MVISPTGDLLATATNDHRVILWDKAGKHLTTFSGHTGRISGLEFSPKGERLLSYSEDGTARIWMVDPDELIQSFNWTDPLDPDWPSSYGLPDSW